MEKIKLEDIKVVVMNPECIPIAQDRLFGFLCDKFLKESINEK